MSLLKKSFCLLISFSILLQVCGCSHKEESKPVVIDTNCDMTSEDYVCGNGDVEDLYFKSVRCTVPQQVCLNTHTVFKWGDGAMIIVPASENEGKDNQTKAYIVDFDGSLRSSITFDGDCNYSAITEGIFANWNDQYVISAAEGDSFIIYDLSGKVVAHSGSEDPEFGETRSVIGYGDTFVIAAEMGIIQYDSNYKEIGRIKYNTYIADPNLAVQKGKIYLNDKGNIFNVDFNSMSMERKSSLGSVEDLETWKGSYTKVVGNNYYSMIESMHDPSYFWEADLDASTIHKTLKTSNMLLIPPRYDYAYMSSYVAPIDKLHYILLYEYDNHDMDIILISPDTENDYASREKITLRGKYLFNDDMIKAAQYQFNTSQDKYYLELQNMMPPGDDQEQYRLNVIKDIQNGDAPDIFYGNDFDYVYWGNSGIVLDMKPYLKANGGFDEGSILPNLLGLMTGENGEVYQVFPSVCLYGYWGRKKDYGGIDLTLENMKNGEITTGYSKPAASELLYGIFGYDLARMYRNGELTEEAVREAVIIALDKGTGTEDYEAHDQSDLESATDSADMVEESIYYAKRYYALAKLLKDDPVYVGYPSFGRTLKTVTPFTTVAVYSGCKHPEAACEFVSYLLSEECQRSIAASSGGITVNRKILDEELKYLQDPDSIPDDKKEMYQDALLIESDDDIHVYVVPMKRETAECFKQQIESCNNLCIYDWGIKNIISEEISAYYSQGKSADEVAGSLYSRLKVYASENYG